jgi:hypothetical protein
MKVESEHLNDPMPQPPREPESQECCQSGCDPCVYDRYWEAFARFEDELAKWEARQRAGVDR